jgi:hypothetical protein
VLREKAAALRTEPLPPGLRGRCEALARAHTESGARTWLPRLVPVSLTALLVLFTTLAIFSLATHRSSTVLAAQLVADHAKCFRLFASSTTEDATALEAMLSDQYGWDVHIPPSSPRDGIQLIGARRCLYADGRMPHVMYRAHGQDMSLYMLEGVSRAPAEVSTLGHRSRIWSQGGTTFVLVVPEDDSGMTDAVRYVMQAH